MNRKEIKTIIESYKAMAILRSDTSENVLETAESIITGGLPLLEISLTTPDACQVIKELRKSYPKAVIGAGTVNTPEEVEQVVEAGAHFAFSPVFNPPMVQACIDKDIISIPGVLTPSEVFLAIQAGADYVKLFPAGLGGPSYLKALLAPLPGSKIIAVGGVSPDNMQDFFDAGALAVGIASCLFSTKDIKEGNFDSIKKRTRDFVARLNRS